MLRHSNSNNEIVIGDFNSFRVFLIHPVQGVPKKSDTIEIILLL